jgi:hypothetical protein
MFRHSVCNSYPEPSVCYVFPKHASRIQPEVSQFTLPPSRRAHCNSHRNDRLPHPCSRPLPKPRIDCHIVYTCLSLPFQPSSSRPTYLFKTSSSRPPYQALLPRSGSTNILLQLVRIRSLMSIPLREDRITHKPWRRGEYKGFSKQAMPSLTDRDRRKLREAVTYVNPPAMPAQPAMKSIMTLLYREFL